MTDDLGEFVASNTATLPSRRISQSTVTVCTGSVASSPACLSLIDREGVGSDAPSEGSGTGESVASELSSLSLAKKMQIIQ